jgi:hypothetical protein
MTSEIYDDDVADDWAVYIGWGGGTKTDFVSFTVGDEVGIDVMSVEDAVAYYRWF